MENPAPSKSWGKRLFISFANDAFGTSAELWINLQTVYDLWYARQTHESIPLLPKLKVG
jgi:hypothetical protein